MSTVIKPFALERRDRYFNRMNMKEILGRVDRRLAKLDMKPAVASRLATGSPDLIRNWQRAVKDGKNPGASTSTLTKLAQVLRTNIPWLTEEIGEEETTELALSVAREIPLLTWVSAGVLASDSVADEAVGTAKAVLGEGDWIALRVEGESMDRISPPGSIIFVDRGDKRLVTGGFYVIDDGEGNSTYKRFQAQPKMRFEPVSKNKDLPAIYPDNEPTIVGRVKLTMLDLT